ncbi:MAG: hypothetical protein IIA91_07240, partial [Chloroflexi bacterium]|nr:hypothetical protein [Chloroflexota bacterium]
MTTAKRLVSSLRRVAVPLGVMGLVLIVLTVASDLPPDARADFNVADPGACGFNPLTSSSLSDATAGANSDIMTTFDLLAPDCYYDTLVSFIPPKFGVAADADVADGAIVAELRAKVTLGLIGNACNNSLNVKFVMMDATTDTSNVMADAFKDINSDNIPDMMEDRDDDGLPDAVTSYPDFLTRIFPGATPRARLHGQMSVSGVVTSLSMLIFEPGTVLNTPARTITPDPSLGYPSVFILQTMGDPDAISRASPITDFCAPLETDVTSFGITRDNLCTDDGPTPPVCSPIGDFIEGVPGPGGTAPDESGVVYRTNPIVAGTYTPTWFAVSQRDADGDGYENSLDPCPFDADPSWDPRVGSFGTPQTGDSDGDRIPDGCDQSP